jgi:hypothetical protein
MKHFLLAVAILAAIGSPAFGQATVKFEERGFALRLTVESDSSKQVLMRPGMTKVVGKVSVTAASYATDAYYVVVRYSINDGRKSDLVLGKHSLELQAGDVLTVHEVGIVPPPNAALVPLKGESVLVSLMFPAGIANPDGFSGPEEFRSSAMFVAKYGTKTVATRLAEKARNETDERAFGNYRGDQQIAVHRQADPDGKVTADVTVEELSEAIQLGLLQLQLQGWSGEVNKAKALLKK